MKIQAYKLAKPSGWDFYTGKTINYRDNIGKVVKCPNPDKQKGVCSSGVIHASISPNDCFVGAGIPCSAYLVEGAPVCGDNEKYGFYELKVIAEIVELDELFGWKYSEVINPFNPLTRKHKPNKADIDNLGKWDSVRASVGASVRASVRASVGASVRASVWDSVRDSVWASVTASVWDSVGDSVRDSVWAYIGSLFPSVKKWAYIEHKEGKYPFQSCVNLWYRGFVPSFDGKVWRLHSGKGAGIVFEIEANKLT